MDKNDFKNELIELQESLLEELDYDVKVSIQSTCSYPLLNVISDITNYNLRGIREYEIKEWIDEYLKQELLITWKRKLNKIESTLYEFAEYIYKTMDNNLSPEQLYNLYCETIDDITKDIRMNWIEEIVENFPREYLRRVKYYCECFRGILDTHLEQNIENAYYEVSSKMNYLCQALIENCNSNVRDFSRKTQCKSQNLFTSLHIEEQEEISFIDFLNKYNYNLMLDKNIVFLSSRNSYKERDSYHPVIIKEGFLIDEYSGVRLKLPKDYINYIKFGEILQFNNQKLSVEDGQLYLIDKSKKQSATLYDSKLTSEDNKTIYLIDKGTNSTYCRNNDEQTQILVSENYYLLEDKDCSISIIKENQDKYTIKDMKPHKDTRDYFYYQEKILKISPYLFREMGYATVDIKDKNDQILETSNQVL